jgi:hypothetical protein
VREREAAMVGRRCTPEGGGGSGQRGGGRGGPGVALASVPRSSRPVGDARGESRGEPFSISSHEVFSI